MAQAAPTALELRPADSPGAWGGLAAVAERWELLLRLVQKDLTLRYRGSVLGVAWSLLGPLLMMLVFTVVFTRIISLPVKPYSLFVLSGLLPWTAFSTGLTGGAMSVIVNANLVKKVSFPVAILPLATTLSAFVNLLLSLIALAVLEAAYAAFGQGVPLWPAVLALPVLLAAQLVLSAGLGLMLAALTVYFRDIEHFLALLLLALFYGTAIIYPFNADLTSDGRALGGGGIRQVLGLNPLTWLLDSYHEVLFKGHWPHPDQLAGVVVTALVCFFGGVAIFSRLQGGLAEET